MPGRDSPWAPLGWRFVNPRSLQLPGGTHPRAPDAVPGLCVPAPEGPHACAAAGPGPAGGRGEARLPLPPNSPSPPEGRGLLPLTTWPCMSPTQCNGRRAKLLACDGNEIDTMFVDRRGTAEPQGQKLVRGSRELQGSVGGQWGFWGIPFLPQPPGGTAADSPISQLHPKDLFI